MFIYQLGIPVLGICYGMQIMAFQHGSVVQSAGSSGEFGKEILTVTPNPLIPSNFLDSNNQLVVWMSHQDEVATLPDGFYCFASTTRCKYAGIMNEQQGLYGVQFHPEANESVYGSDIIKNFVLNICKVTSFRNIETTFDSKCKEIQSSVGNGKVLVATSGGVDSSCLLMLLSRALKSDQIVAIHINTGAMYGDEEDVIIPELEKYCKIKIIKINGSDLFFDRLKDVSKGSSVREIVGTIYSDVIESGMGSQSLGVVIKRHHNTILSDKLNLKLLEPFKDLFKHEVRKVGRKLGLPEFIINRHPSPGPGLFLCVTEVNRKNIELVRTCNNIWLDALRTTLDKVTGKTYYESVSQAFVYMNGDSYPAVKGDCGFEGPGICLRAVNSRDFMTATIPDFPMSFLVSVGNKIMTVEGCNRVSFDLTEKGPGTVMPN